MLLEDASTQTDPVINSDHIFVKESALDDINKLNQGDRTSLELKPDQIRSGNIDIKRKSIFEDIQIQDDSEIAESPSLEQSPSPSPQLGSPLQSPKVCSNFFLFFLICLLIYLEFPKATTSSRSKASVSSIESLQFPNNKSFKFTVSINITIPFSTTKSQRFSKIHSPKTKINSRNYF